MSVEHDVSLHIDPDDATVEAQCSCGWKAPLGHTPTVDAAYGAAIRHRTSADYKALTQHDAPSE